MAMKMDPRKSYQNVPERASVSKAATQAVPERASVSKESTQTVPEWASALKGAFVQVTPAQGFTEWSITIPVPASVPEPASVPVPASVPCAINKPSGATSAIHAKLDKYKLNALCQFSVEWLAMQNHPRPSLQHVATKSCEMHVAIEHFINIHTKLELNQPLTAVVAYEKLEPLTWHWSAQSASHFANEINTELFNWAVRGTEKYLDELGIDVARKMIEYEIYEHMCTKEEMVYVNEHRDYLISQMGRRPRAKLHTLTKKPHFYSAVCLDGGQLVLAPSKNPWHIDDGPQETVTRGGKKSAKSSGEIPEKKPVGLSGEAVTRPGQKSVTETTKSSGEILEKKPVGLSGEAVSRVRRTSEKVVKQKPSIRELEEILTKKKKLKSTINAQSQNLSNGQPYIRVVANNPISISCHMPGEMIQKLRTELNRRMYECSVTCTDKLLAMTEKVEARLGDEYEEMGKMFSQQELSQLSKSKDDDRVDRSDTMNRALGYKRRELPEFYEAPVVKGNRAELVPDRKPW